MRLKIRFTPCKMSLILLHTVLPIIAASAALNLLHLVTSSPEDMLSTVTITLYAFENVLISLCITAFSCALCELQSKR